ALLPQAIEHCAKRRVLDWREVLGLTRNQFRQRSACYAGSFSVGLVDPTFLPDQRNEHHAAKIFLLELVGVDARDPEQTLNAFIANRDDQASADFQLPLQRDRNRRTAGGHDDGIERRLFRPSFRAVADADENISMARAMEA